MKFTDINKKPIITVEIPPPKGADYQKNLDLAIALKGKADLINVTDNQRAVMRMSPLAFSKILLDNGLEPNMQLCCRDRNRLALQSDILGAHALGIQNITLMTGDYTMAGDHKEGKPVFDFDSVHLIECAKQLENAENAVGKKLNGGTDLAIGAVSNPYYQPMELHVLKMLKKVDAGADFFQTQPVFSKEKVIEFLDLCKKEGIKQKILIGVTLLKSTKFIEFMNKNILTEPIDEALAIRIAESSDPTKESINIALEFMNDIKDIVDGFHLMPIGTEEHMPELLDRFHAANSTTS